MGTRRYNFAESTPPPKKETGPWIMRAVVTTGLLVGFAALYQSVYLRLF